MTAALLALTTGCGGFGPAEADPVTHHPVKDTTITAKPGERFSLTVDQNPSTREYWYLTDPRPDSSVLVSRGKEPAPDSGDGTAPGAPAPLVFTFEATGKGTTSFTLLHCTFTTCQGNTADRPPATTGPSAAPTATPTASPAPTPQSPERITYTVTVG